MKTLMSILIPPIGAAMKGAGGSAVFINIILTFLGWLPGVIHALLTKDKSNPTIVINNNVGK